MRPWERPRSITQRGNTFSFVDNLTWIRGRHTFKFGADIRRQMLDVRNIGPTEATFGFTGVFAGNSIADFLIGIPQTANAAAPPGPDGVNLSTVWQGFAQDDWKATDNLTLNLGVRYEYQAPFINDRGQRSIFDPTFPGGRLLYGGPRRLLRSRQGFTETDRPLVPSGLVPPDRNNFAPRVGFAWSPFGTRRNVVRGSYGLFYEAAKCQQRNSVRQLQLSPPAQLPDHQRCHKAELYLVEPVPVAGDGRRHRLQLTGSPYADRLCPAVEL